MQVAPELLACRGKYLDYDDVMKKFDAICDWLAKLYINTLNVIHYMHDKYCYEKIQMALHDDEVLRTMACGMAGPFGGCGFPVRHQVRQGAPHPRRTTAWPWTSRSRATIPKFGNNDPRVDDIAVDVVKTLHDASCANAPPTAQSMPTLSILTITSNVVYGKKTGSTPDGRKRGRALRPRSQPHARPGSDTAAWPP